MYIKLIEKIGSLLLRNSIFNKILFIKYNNDIDINNFEALDTIRFSKQSNTNSFTGGVYTFYNLSTLTEDDKICPEGYVFKNKGCDDVPTSVFTNSKPLQPAL